MAEQISVRVDFTSDPAIAAIAKLRECLRAADEALVELANAASVRGSVETDSVDAA